MSPGRSANQAKPAATSARATRKKTTRIIAPSPCPERARRIGGESIRGIERGLPRLGLGDPGLRRRAGGLGQLAEIGERGWDIGTRACDLDARQHGGRIV